MNAEYSALASARGRERCTDSETRAGELMAPGWRDGPSQWAAPVVRGLEGLIAPPYEGDFGLKVPYHGVPRFRQCSFAAAELRESLEARLRELMAYWIGNDEHKARVSAPQLLHGSVS